MRLHLSSVGDQLELIVLFGSEEPPPCEMHASASLSKCYKKHYRISIAKNAHLDTINVSFCIILALINAVFVILNLHQQFLFGKMK